MEKFRGSQERSRALSGCCTARGCWQQGRGHRRAQTETNMACLLEEESLPSE